MKHTIVILFGFMGLSAYSAEGEWEVKKPAKTGFVEISVISQFTPSDSFVHYESGPDIIFGSHFMPQQTAVLGFRFGVRSDTTFVLGYEYDFVRSADWIPGFNTSAIFGLTDRTDNQYLALGVDFGFFLKKRIGWNFIMLLRTGIRPELISVKNPKKLSDLPVNLYLGLGIRWLFF